MNPLSRTARKKRCDAETMRMFLRVIFFKGFFTGAAIAGCSYYIYLRMGF